MKYKGICHKCGEMVVKGQGCHKRIKGSWRTEHIVCEGEKAVG